MVQLCPCVTWNFFPNLCDFALIVFTVSISIMIFFSFWKRRNSCSSLAGCVRVVPLDKNVHYVLNCLLVAREAMVLIYSKSLNFASFHIYRIPSFGFSFPQIFIFPCFQLEFWKEGYFPNNFILFMSTTSRKTQIHQANVLSISNIQSTKINKARRKGKPCCPF